MPLILPHTHVKGTPARAPHVQENLETLRDALNTQSAGQLIIADSSGNPRPQAVSGGATIDADGVITLNPPAGSIDSSELADGSVIEDKLGSQAVTNGKLGINAVRASRIWIHRRQASNTVSANSSGATVINAGSGEKITGFGGGFFSGTSTTSLIRMEINTDLTQATIFGWNGFGSSQTLWAWAICVVAG